MSSKKRPAPLVIGGAVLLAAAAAALYVFVLAGPPSLARLRGGRDFNVIVITLDTTRADRLPCYGRRDLETPTIDAFAARGVRFENCFAQTPLTLPSHTTLMTGTLPLYHGIRDNGGFFVPEKLKTMAELFKDKGYETGAFIAAYVLDSKWGLNQGFDTYYDKFDLSKFKRISLGTVQRPANEVLDQALPWLDDHGRTRSSSPGSIFTTRIPRTTRRRHTTSSMPIAPIWARSLSPTPSLAGSGAGSDRTACSRRPSSSSPADHGESLGEHGEQSHGFFIYQGAIHVPLIVVTPFPKLQGVVSGRGGHAGRHPADGL